MAYTYASWSVVFGEQPTATKWNILGTNDVSFNERIGTNWSSGTTSPVWWEELGRATLGSAGDTLASGTIAARKYLEIHIHILSTGGTTLPALQFNGDTATNYAFRNSTDGGADASAGTIANLQLCTATNGHKMLVADILNIAAQEKLVIGQVVSNNATGDANVPDKWEGAGKWENTAAQITSITATNTGTGDFNTGSQIIVRGHD